MLARVSASLHNVGLGDILPLRCNQVPLEDRSSGGEATITDLVSVHLKNLDIWGFQVLEQVVHLEVSALGGLLAIQGGDMAVVYVTASYGHLRRADIME